MYFTVLILFAKSVPSGCVPGVTRYLWYPSTKTSIASNSGTFGGGSSHNDFGFCGSFCPEADDYYRIIVEGTKVTSYETGHSYYYFHNITSRQRTTPYLYLIKGACYGYLLKASTGERQSSGRFYVQREGYTKNLLYNNQSFNCHKSFCLDSNLEFPECKTLPTFSLSRSKISLSFLLIHLNIF